GRGGVDLHLRGRGVGKGVNVEVLQRQPAGDGEGQCPDDHQEAVVQRKVDDPAEHGGSSSSTSGVGNCAFLRRSRERLRQRPPAQGSPRVSLRRMPRRTLLPWVATTSEGSTPARISVYCSSLAPVRTCRT